MNLEGIDRTILLASEVEYLIDKILDVLGPDDLTLGCGHHWSFDYEAAEWRCPDDAALHCCGCWDALQKGLLQ